MDPYREQCSTLFSDSLSLFKGHDSVEEFLLRVSSLHKQTLVTSNWKYLLIQIIETETNIWNCVCIRNHILDPLKINVQKILADIKRVEGQTVLFAPKDGHPFQIRVPLSGAPPFFCNQMG